MLLNKQRQAAPLLAILPERTNPPSNPLPQPPLKATAHPYLPPAALPAPSHLQFIPGPDQPAADRNESQVLSSDVGAFEGKDVGEDVCGGVQ